MNDADAPPQLGPFEISDRLGEGGMGAVFRATHDRTGVDVALKVVKGDGDEFSRQFHREVQAHAGLVHPGVVYLFDYGDIDDEAAEQSAELTAGSPWVAMELADRGTVRDLLPLRSWHEIREVLVQTLDALAYAHARDVVHRDLKPENLLVFDADEAARIKLADFGIAHAFDDVDDQQTDELRNTAGTPLYMSPEQIRGRWRDYGPWTDIYSLGCIAYQLVCGKPPFIADNLVTLTVHHCNEDRPRLDPQFPVPDGLDAWIRRAMAIDPTERFQRAADAARALPVGDELSRTSRAESGKDIETMETIEAGNDLTTTRVAATKTATLPATEILTELAATETENSDDPPPPSTSRTGRKAPGRSATSPATGKESAPSSPDESLQTSSPATSESGGSGPTPHGGGSMGASRTSEKLDIHPDWQADSLHELPTPLIGTGLGLFGLRESPFVDREDERNSIWDALDDVVTDETFRCVLLSGESGTGKSRLARWVARRADEMGAATVTKALHTPGGEGRTGGLAGLVLRTVRGWRLNRKDLYDHLLENLPILQGGNDPREADARALTELVHPTSRSDDDVDGPRFEFDGSRQKCRVVTRLLERIGDDRPLLVWLDDLQWGQQTLELLEHLTGHDDRPSALVVATLRSDVLAETPRLDERIDDLEELDETTRHELEPLSGPDHRLFIDRLLPLAPGLADQIATRTEGNPLFAHQLIGELVDDEALIVSDRGFETTSDRDLELPDDIYELWTRRIQRLLDDHYPNRPDRVGQTIEIAAALGREVDLQEWSAACREAGLEVPDRLVDRLVDRGLASRTDDGWAFPHGMIAEAVRRYSREADRYGHHHRVCARMLEDRYSHRPEQTALRRANHWIEADQLHSALEPLSVEIERLGRLGDLQQCHQLLEYQRDIIDRLDLAPHARPRLKNSLQLGWTYYHGGHTAEAIERLEPVVRRCRNQGYDRLLTSAACRLGTLQFRTHSFGAARRYFDEALELAVETDNTALQVRCRLQLARLALCRTNRSETRRQFQQTSELLEGGDNPYLELQLLLSEARADLLKGDYQAAQSKYETAYRRSRQQGFVPMATTALDGLSDIARFRGDLETARRRLQRARRFDDKRGRNDDRIGIHFNLAMTELAADCVDEARHHYRIARRRGSSELGIVRDSRYASLFDCLDMALGCRLGDWSRFDRTFESYRNGWPDETPVLRDHAWLLELCAEDAIQAKLTDRARRLLELPHRLYYQLDDTEAVARIERRLQTLEKSDR